MTRHLAILRIYINFELKFFTMNKTKYLLTFIIAGFVLISANPDNTKRKESGKSISVFETIALSLKLKTPVDTFHNDLASVIAAQVPIKHFKQIEQKNFWPKFQKAVKTDWDTVCHYKIKPIKKWTDSLTLKPATDSNTLFYPFAGADFLYANSFFPNARNYILVGLEPVGKLNNLDSLNANSLERYLFKIEHSLYFSNKLGFFRTQSMRSQLNQYDLNGTIHLLTFYIKRCGYTISGINYIELDSTGNEKFYDRKNKTKPYGLRIDFCDTNREKPQTLYYFSYNIADDYLAAHPELLLFAKKFGKQSTFLKAASYLMHGSAFSKIRNYIIENSDLVLQDDSGIPFKAFENNLWDIKLFGTYTRTIPLFAHRSQPDLKKAISESPYKGKVPFRIGYNVTHKEVNLLYATKKA